MTPLMISRCGRLRCATVRSPQNIEDAMLSDVDHSVNDTDVALLREKNATLDIVFHDFLSHQTSRRDSQRLRSCRVGWHDCYWDSRDMMMEGAKLEQANP
jgi:hypothetical protein